MTALWKAVSTRMRRAKVPRASSFSISASMASTSPDSVTDVGLLMAATETRPPYSAINASASDASISIAAIAP